MAQFINRKVALSHPFANGKYDHDHANEEFIFGYESYREWLEDLPFVEMKEWIPVSERLPEEHDDVLVCFEYFRFGEYNCLFKTIGIGALCNDFWLINHETRWSQLRVIAWMPLPEPYSEEDET